MTFRRIVWPLAVAETLVWAALYYSFPALLLEWERDLGWSKTELVGALTLALMTSALLGPVTGRFIDRGFGRLVFSGSAALGTVLLAGLAWVEHLWQFYCLWFGIGVAMAGALYEACFSVLTHALGNEARRAITIVTLVAGLAGTLAFPSLHLLVGWVGWRDAVVIVAGVNLLVAVPLIWNACWHADQMRADQHAPGSAHPGVASRALRTPVFWLLAVAFSMAYVEHFSLLTHLLPLLSERGLSDEVAVLTASSIGPMQVVGRLAMLAVEKYVSTFWIAFTCFLAMSGAATALFCSQAIPMLLPLFVVLQGAGIGMSSILRPVMTAELLGRAHFGIISGFLAIPSILAAALAPTLAALVWRMGGYEMVILMAILTALVGLGCISSIPLLASRR
ncbi:MAG: MFS transporter [Desulfurellaceae bacterium]|nr:MFS transporter [Desulfurellaceae bacterium]